MEILECIRDALFAFVRIQVISFRIKLHPHKNIFKSHFLPNPEFFAEENLKIEQYKSFNIMGISEKVGLF